VDLANLGSESETCVGSRVRLVGVSISFEKNFLSAPIHSPLSGSPFRSYNVCVESRAIDPSFDQEDAEDLEYTAPDNDCSNGNEGVMSLPTM
jgi:hypothetical protein